MIIYTTGSTCGRCNALKDAFQKAQIAYEELPLSPSVIADCLCDTGEHIMTAPLVKDGAVWRFHDDFFDAAGNLKSNWLIELKGVRPHKEFGGMGGQPDQIERSSKKIWGSK